MAPVVKRSPYQGYRAHVITVMEPKNIEGLPLVICEERLPWIAESVEIMSVGEPTMRGAGLASCT